MDKTIINKKIKKCVIIYNKKSGKVKKATLIDYFYEVLNKYNIEVEVVVTKRKGNGAEIIEKLDDNIDLVIAAGGDGTFNEVVRGNLKRKKKLLLAHLPLGTVNDVGSMYGFTKNYKTDLDLIINGVVKNIDVIMINDIPFTYVAAYGNFTNISYDTPKKLKEKFGRFGYILFGLSEFKQRIELNHLKIRIGDKEKEGDYSYIFISNTNRIGGVENIYPDVKLDDNKFEVLFCNLKNKGELLKTLFEAVKNGNISKMNNCEYYCIDDIEIEFDKIPKYSWGIDGEKYETDTNKFKFTINKEINVLLPSNNIDKLFIKEKN